MTKRVHQGVIAIAAVTGAKQVSHKQVELAIAQTVEEIGEKLLFLLRPDIVERVVRAGFFQRCSNTSAD